MSTGMDFSEILVELRTGVGSSQVKKLRAQNRVPGVVYSGGSASLAVSFDSREFTKLARGARPAKIFKFKSENKELNGTLAFVKEVQIEPLKEILMHVDFLSIREGEPVSIRIPLTTYGDSAVVREGRAILNQIVYEIEVECPPNAIPEVLEIDISNLQEGASMLAKDLPLPAGCKLRSSAQQVVVTMFSTKKAKAEEEAAKAATATAAAATPAATPAAAAKPAAGAKPAPAAKK